MIVPIARCPCSSPVTLSTDARPAARESSAARAWGSSASPAWVRTAASWTPFEKRLFHLAFKRLDMGADAGLGEMNSFGGAGEGTGIDHRDKAFELMQVHVSGAGRYWPDSANAASLSTEACSRSDVVLRARTSLFSSVRFVQSYVWVSWVRPSSSGCSSHRHR